MLLQMLVLLVNLSRQFTDSFGFLSLYCLAFFLFAVHESVVCIVLLRTDMIITVSLVGFCEIYHFFSPILNFVVYMLLKDICSETALVFQAFETVFY